MIDERTEELVHADIDGCLDDAGRLELEQRLAADPEARALHADLRKMDQAWAGIAPLPVPPDLQARLRQLRLPAARPAHRPTRYLRPAMALAAGLMLAVLGLNRFAPGVFQPLGADSGEMGATLAARPVPAGNGRELVLGSPGLLGKVVLVPAANHWQLRFDLVSEQPVRVSLTYDATALRLLEYPPDVVAGGIGADGWARFESSGRQQRELLLQPVGRGAGIPTGRIALRFESGGRLLQEGVLEVRPSADPP